MITLRINDYIKYRVTNHNGYATMKSRVHRVKSNSYS